MIIYICFCFVCVRLPPCSNGTTPLFPSTPVARMDGLWTGSLWRFLQGVGLAGTYMPGLKALTDRLPVSAQSRGVAFYTSSFGIGASLSFLFAGEIAARSEEHTSELQSLMRISYAVFCVKTQTCKLTTPT